MIPRSPFAGTWYPGTRARIEAQLKEFDAHAVNRRKLRKPPTAGVVPHAGWMYSGVLAYEVWRILASGAPDTVVLFGGHLQSHQRPMLLIGEGFETPLGSLALERDVISALSAAFRFKELTEAQWVPDNTIEVHLPMIQHLLPEARLVVLLMPPRDVILDVVDQLAEILRYQGRRAIYVGSTDLTHYGPRYGNTLHGTGAAALHWAKEENDARFITNLLELNPLGCIDEGLSSGSACCPGAAAAAVTAARLNGAEYGELLTHTTSWEAHPEGEPQDFVGYASVVF
ncbi:MAG: AmmeMemoRadiSam system protein B [Deltaproteobacteria bacterium]|nr:AmmeMemoRadiSam system protein B [Deltaproteobacteria bacterium]